MSRYEDLFAVPETFNPAPVGEVAPDQFSIEINDLCEFIKRQLHRADDAGRPWNARVTAAGAIHVPHPGQPGKMTLLPDGSWAIIIRIAAPGRALQVVPTQQLEGIPQVG